MTQMIQTACTNDTTTGGQHLILSLLSLLSQHGAESGSIKFLQVTTLSRHEGVFAAFRFPIFKLSIIGYFLIVFGWAEFFNL